MDIWPRDTENGDITIQNCILAETLYESIHEETYHSRAMLVGNNAHRVSIVGNLFAHNNRRHPAFTSGADSIDAVNNVVYNYGQIGIHYNGVDGPITNVNVLNNYFRTGADSRDDPLYVEWYFQELDEASSIAIAGNVARRREHLCSPSRRRATASPIASCSSDYTGPECSGFCLLDAPVRDARRTSSSQSRESMHTRTMTRDVGASVPSARRARHFEMLADVEDRTGTIVNCVEADGSERCERNGGGYPRHRHGRHPPRLSDRDGIPDDLGDETTVSTQTTPDDGTARFDLSTIYTNVEVYLFTLAGDLD